MGLAPTVDDTNGAVPAEILSGKTLWGLTSGNWGLKTGTMTNNGAANYTPGTTDQTVAEGYHNGSGQVYGDADLVTPNIRSGINIFGVAGDSNVVNTSSGDAVSGDILTGKKAWVDGSEMTGSLTCPPPTGNAVVGDVLSGKTFSNSSGTGHTGTMPNQGATNYTPGTTNQIISAGYYNGLGNVFGDADLLVGNIKAGTEIFGVTGTFPNDGTAATGDVKNGSTFYTNSATILTGTGTKTLSPANDMVSAGYYEATNLSAVDTDLAAGNIKKDVDIFGVIGTYPLAAIAKTGQTTSYAPGDDGNLQKGIAWPNPRFTDNTDGTVTDNLTGLIWLKQANYNDTSGTTGTATWANAISFCNALESGQCGLSDGSSAGDWRLPNVRELFSLVGLAFNSPALCNAAGTAQWTTGDPFMNVQTIWYWTSSRSAFSGNYRWSVDFWHGSPDDDSSAGCYIGSPGTSYDYVWPVRGGQ